MTLDRIEYIKSDIMGKSSIRENELSKGLAAKTWGNSNQGEIIKKERGNPENLMPWIIGEFKQGIKTIPKKIKSLVIYGGIILAVNLIFWTVEPYFLPSYLQPFRSLISAVVFLTATYNDVIPKTIFWVIVFTFGKRLFKQARKRGFIKTFDCMKNTVPMFKNALSSLGKRAYPALLAGTGIGLMVANNFASYSRFSGARNKFDKYFIVMVIAFSVSYLLGEANKTGIFKFVKLGSNDIAKLMGKSKGLSDCTRWKRRPGSASRFFENDSLCT